MNELIKKDGIAGKIYLIRGVQVMLDSKLAELYGIPVKRLNEQVKRNVIRFPEEFWFQLSEEEFKNLRSQNASLESGRGQSRKYLPLTFLESDVSSPSTIPAKPMSSDMLKSAGCFFLGGCGEL